MMMNKFVTFVRRIIRERIVHCPLLYDTARTIYDPSNYDTAEVFIFFRAGVLTLDGETTTNYRVVFVERASYSYIHGQKSGQPNVKCYSISTALCQCSKHSISWREKLTDR